MDPMEKVHEVVTKNLTCSVCTDVKSNLMQCFNGHMHCTTCMDSMREHSSTRTLCCSVCRTRRGWTKSRGTIEIAESLQILFECGIDGCDARLLISELDAHRAACPQKLFECPLLCDCEPMKLPELTDHMKTHRKTVRRMTSQECFNMLVLANELSRSSIVLFGQHVICIGVSLRMCHYDSVCVELKAGVIGHPGHNPNIRMGVELYDLCSSDTTKTSIELRAIEGQECLSNSHILHCYDNFVQCYNLANTIAVEEDQWTRATFLNRCQTEVFAYEYDNEAIRIAALVIQFENIDSYD